ncbi:MAG: F0F1 ATP synthase subunit gamma [Pseudomonadota bacterium]|nr:F0F1 ATP synthase subunit gamma [Pseudomonadota bacterium]
MPSLRDLKNRITSVKSTQKITSAMKMVAASKLRRAQEQAEAGRPYADRMARMLASLSAGMAGEEIPPLLAGTGRDQVHLLVVLTSDRGLCGAFNGSVVREIRRKINDLVARGKTVKLLCVGRKGRDLLRRQYPGLIVASFEDVGRKRLSFDDADRITTRILEMFGNGEFDVATLVYNKFRSAISQVVTLQQVVPAPVPATQAGATAGYEFEPDESRILADLLPRNLAVQVYSALLESAASEQGARMTAMDNATRNAGDMIRRLTLTYNRSRQAYITRELIEIISGAEAV